VTYFIFATRIVAIQKAKKEAHGMAIQNLLRLPQVEAATGYRRSSIYRLIKNREFPAPILLSKNGRASAWIEAEVQQWIEQRIAESRKENLV
jgi:prophage regulatory protein